MAARDRREVAIAHLERHGAGIEAPTLEPPGCARAHARHFLLHALDVDEIKWLVREYGESTRIALEEGVDAVEIHANHDDVVQWFLSPLTNHRTDQYGGSFENRIRYLREITESIRSHAPKPFTYGLRLCMDEFIDGGYGVEECMKFVETFTADGTVDYFSLDVGSNFGSPSYVQVGWHDDAEWAGLCGTIKQATNLPVVYCGRVTTPEQADAIIAAGQADVVAVVRATIADTEFLNKAKGVNPEPLKPCIGLNECINRKQVEGLPYACGVSTRWAREWELRDLPSRTSKPRNVLVVGAGPAGTELACQLTEQGHTVRLWEKADRVGGLLNVAAKLRSKSSTSLPKQKRVASYVAANAASAGSRRARCCRDKSRNGTFMLGSSKTRNRPRCTTSI